MGVHLFTGDIDDGILLIYMTLILHCKRDHVIHVGTTRPSFDCEPIHLSFRSPSLFPLSRESKIFKTLSLSAQLMSSIFTLHFSMSTFDPFPLPSASISFLTFKHRGDTLFYLIVFHWGTE